MHHLSLLSRYFANTEN